MIKDGNKEDNKKGQFDNPFGYDAFADINKIATILNYDVYSVLEHASQKDNPFQMMNTDILSCIKDYSKQLESVEKENRSSLKLLKSQAIKEI